MVVIQGKSKRKSSGKKKKGYRGKRLFERGSFPSLTRIGEASIRVVRTKGGSVKRKALLRNVANVLDTKSNKWHKAKIMTVVENPANRHYIRRNIMTKGTVIETEKGKARITSRPGQDGVINAVLI